jgi:3'-5' exonuclease
MTHASEECRPGIILDIETAGYPFESLDEARQEYLLHFAGTPEERELEMKKVNLYPFTARLICIGLMNVATGAARILVQAPEGTEQWEDAGGMVRFLPGNEHAMLRQFWEWIPRFGQIVTFNGRAFDGPFLHLRSAILGIRATRNLVPYRYDSSRHCDLLEQFTFYAMTRKFNLDFYCEGFGIPSPKRQGITGHDMNALFAEGRYRKIAEYNHGDLCATRALFERWRDFVQVARAE